MKSSSYESVRWHDAFMCGSSSPLTDRQDAERSRSVKPKSKSDKILAIHINYPNFE